MMNSQERKKRRNNRIEIEVGIADQTKEKATDFRQGKVLDSAGVKTEPGPAVFQGVQPITSQNDDTTSLVTRLEPIAWFRLNDLDCNDGGPP